MLVLVMQCLLVSQTMSYVIVMQCLELPCEIMRYELLVYSGMGYITYRL